MDQQEQPTTDYMSLSPQEFEHFVAEVFRRKGYLAEVTSFSGDFGADIIVTSDIAKAVVQVKQFDPAYKVGVKDVTHLIGSKQFYSCDSAIVITSGTYTKAAREMAAKTGVQLWDGNAFRTFVESSGIEVVLRKPEENASDRNIRLYRHLVSESDVRKWGLATACTFKMMEVDRQNEMAKREREAREQASYLTHQKKPVATGKTGCLGSIAFFLMKT